MRRRLRTLALRPLALRLVAIRLVLIAYLLSGLAPARALVLCLEADGSVALELALDAGACEPCPEAPCPDEPAEGCACIDIPLPSSDGFGRGPEIPRVESVALAPFAAPPLPTLVAVEPAPSVAPARDDPRPAPGLASLRTVVLRV